MYSNLKHRGSRVIYNCFLFVLLDNKEGEKMEFINAKTILSKVKKGNFDWFGIDYNMNLYRGCNHGCIYCDSRSKCYQIENFDKVQGKKNAIEILQREIERKRTKGVVGLGAMSDSYNPFEKTYQLTRQALALLAYYGFGVSLETKSDLVVRDIDLLQKITNHHSAIVKFTITTFDDQLSKQIEPYAPVSSKRFAAMKKLSEAGIYTGVLLNPVLPFLTDTEENIQKIVEKAYQNGAKFVYASFGVTLREGNREYYYQKLQKHFPNLVEKYEKTYHKQYMCMSYNKKLYAFFKQTCEKYHLHYRMSDIIKDYQKEEKLIEQLQLFKEN